MFCRCFFFVVGGAGSLRGGGPAGAEPIRLLGLRIWVQIEALTGFWLHVMPAGPSTYRRSPCTSSQRHCPRPKKRLSFLCLVPLEYGSTYAWVCVPSSPWFCEASAYPEGQELFQGTLPADPKSYLHCPPAFLKATCVMV